MSSVDFSRGYSASFYCALVNPRTWNDESRFEVPDGMISRDEADIRQSATITVKGINGLADSWIRIYMEANQNGNTTKVPLFTGIVSSPNTNYKDGVTTYSLTCYSVLKVISDIVLPIGWYIPAGANAIDRIRSLLSPIGTDVIVPENVDYSRKILSDTLIAENDETNLTMIDAILSSIGWMLQIDGSGIIYLSPIPYPETDFPVSILAPDRNIIETTFSISDDWFDCPNVMRVTYGDLVATARDDDPDSMFSTVNRGREIWATEDSPSLSSNESLAKYAMNRLKEEQNRSISVNYTRRFLPEINQGDYIKLNYDEIKGDFYVNSQTITLGPAAKVSETIFSYN